jgi:hypothetical protein
MIKKERPVIHSTPLDRIKPHKKRLSHAHLCFDHEGTPFRVLVKFAFMTKHQFQPPSIGFGHLSPQASLTSILSHSDNHFVDYMLHHRLLRGALKKKPQNFSEFG